MLANLCTRFIKASGRDSRIHLCFLRILSVESFSSISESENKASPALTYLINSCGLSPEEALSACEKIRLESTSRTDSILELLRSYNFDKAHIRCIVSYWPRVLLCRKNNLQPKLEFIKDFGVPDSDIPDLVTKRPHLLSRGLRSQVIPSLQFLKGLVHSTENVGKALKRSQWLVTIDLKKKMQPNIDLLKDKGVTDSRIAIVVMTQPRLLMQKPETLEATIRRVEELGFKRGSPFFVLAIHSLSSMSKATWDSKVELLKNLGFSQEQILVAFRRMPMFLNISDKKLKSGVDFFINQLKFTPAQISSRPLTLMYSMEKRVIPRFRVWWILRSLDLVKGKEKLLRMWLLTERDFLRRYILEYESEVPHLMKVYENKLELGWLTPVTRGKKEAS